MWHHHYDDGNTIPMRQERKPPKHLVRDLRVTQTRRRGNQADADLAMTATSAHKEGNGNILPYVEAGEAARFEN